MLMLKGWVEIKDTEKEDERLASGMGGALEMTDSEG